MRRLGVALMVAAAFGAVHPPPPRSPAAPPPSSTRAAGPPAGGSRPPAAAEAAAGPVDGATWLPRTPAYAEYFTWAEGYLTARAEDGGMRRDAYRPQRAAPAMRFLAGFCRDHPMQSFYAAVIELAQAMARHGPPVDGLTGGAKP